MAGRRFDLTSLTFTFILLVSVAIQTINSEKTLVANCGETAFLDEENPEIQVTLRNDLASSSEDEEKCLWFVRSPPGTTLRLDAVDFIDHTLLVVDGFVNRGNDTTAVEMDGYEMKTFASQGRAVTCRPAKESDEQVDLVLSVKMKGDISIDAANPGQCGGTIHLNLTSPTATLQATNSYPSGGAAYCYWYIHSPAGTHIVLKFRQLKLDDNDRLYIYDSTGQILSNAYELSEILHPVYAQSYARVRFDAYYSVSDATVEMIVNYIDRLNGSETLVSSAGVIELDGDMPSLTVSSSGYPSSVYYEGYWYVTSPPGTRIKVSYNSLQTGTYVYLNVYDSSSTNYEISSFSNSVPLPLDTVFAGNVATFRLYASWDVIGAGVDFTVSITDDNQSLSQCGGKRELNAYNPNINISSPYYHSQQTSTGQTSCTWYVSASAGHEAELTWRDVETSSEYVRLYDNPTGKAYYVSSLRGNINYWDISPFGSTHGGLTVHLYDSSAGNDGQGFLADIALTDLKPYVGPRSCGGSISLSSAMPNFTFNSPYYNLPTSSGEVDCRWYVSAPSGKEVELTWRDVETSSEYIRLYDYPISTSYQVSYFQGDISHEDISPLVSSRGGLLLLFEDYSTGSNGNGFLADVALTDPISHQGPRSCGGSISMSSAMPHLTFSSPNYDEPTFSGYVDCWWYVSASSGQQVKLTWLDIETVNSAVSIYDYPLSTSSTYQVSYIRTHLDMNISPITSTRNGLTILYDDFTSGANGRGFQVELHFTDVEPTSLAESCGGTIYVTNASAVIPMSTPYFMSATTNVDCWWHIIGPAGLYVHLTILDFSTTSYEYVDIYEHPSSMSSSYQTSHLMGQLHNTTNVIAAGGDLTIRYTDGSDSQNGPGFSAEIRFTDGPIASLASSCGGTISIPDATSPIPMSTPVFSESANADVDCWWYLSSPSGRELFFTLLDLDTTSSECVYIYDYPSSNSYQISTLSGRVESRTSIISSRGGLSIRYSDSSSSQNGPGLTAEMTITDAATIPSSLEGSCGGTFYLSDNSPRTILHSPQYFHPSSANAFIECWWYLVSQAGKQIEMSAKDMETNNEYLRIYDNPSSRTSTQQLSHLRGNINESTVVSTNGGLSLFFADYSSGRNGRGFLLDVSLTDGFSWNNGVFESCGQAIHLDHASPSITFSTLTYPTEVTNDFYECFWYYTCPSGYRLVMEFLDFDTYSNSRFEVHDYQYYQSSKQLAYMSSGSVAYSTVIHSSNNYLTAYFYDGDWSDSANQRGVLASVSMVSKNVPVWDSYDPMSSCGGVISLTSYQRSITLTTPDYNDYGGSNFRCTWHFSAESTMILEFEDFWLGSSAYLRVHDGPSTGYAQLLYATGSGLPDSVRSTGNTLTIYYYDSWSTTGIGAKFNVRVLIKDAQIMCDSTTMTVLFDKSLLREGTDEGDIHFEDKNCKAYDHDSHNYALSTTYDSCQTEMEVNSRFVVFSNVVTYNSQQPIPGTNITREHALQISVRCELDRRQVLGESFLPITGKISLWEVGYGNFSLSLDRYTDQTFNEVVVDDQAEVGLGDPLYFAVNLMSVGGLAVFIEKCWATPTPYPNNRKSYTFLSDGCAEDPTLQILYHSDPSFQPFIIDAFTFIEENPEVFIHCEVLVCDSDDPTSRCAQGCRSRVRRSGRQPRGTRSAPHLISNGPLSLNRARASKNDDQTSSSFEIQPMALAVGVAIGAVVVFVCLAVVIAMGFIFLRPFRRGDHRGYSRIKVNEDSED